MVPAPLGTDSAADADAARPARDDATPDDAADETLPVRFVDAAGRRIVLRAYADDPGADALREMYAGFDPADRAQGLPPADAVRRRAWLDGLLDDGLHVLAWHDGRVVGHVGLLPVEDGLAELAVFVAHDYQRATIGTHLLRAALDYARANGLERVWLTVERRNRAARGLYESVGFREVAAGREYEYERELRGTAQTA